jgi:V/A-type H+-transporting ATPase subunit I
MMIRPYRMRKFYIAVPQEYEENVAELIGELGFVELFGERERIAAGEDIEAYTTFLRIMDRARVALESTYEIEPPEAVKKPFFERFLDAFRMPHRRVDLRKVDVEQLKELNLRYEDILDEYTSRLDNIRRRMGEIDDLLLKIDMFRRHKIFLDTVGDYTHIFVKAGFIPEANIGKLEDALKPFNVILTLLEGRPKEKFILLAASQKDRENILNILTMLNFEEIVFPPDIERDPDKAYESLIEEREGLRRDIRRLTGDLERFIEELRPYVRYVRYMYNVKSMVMRTRRFSVFYGWVPADRLGELRDKVASVTNGLMHMEAVEPKDEEEPTPPTYLRHPPIIDKFQLIVRMRGVPKYNELDPTFLYTILFSIMYGMMFGDVGQGVVLFILGQMLYRLRKPLLGISYTALNKLGMILSVASIFSIIFGFLYGESFLMHFMDPLWLNPLENPIAISVIAIIFGLIQISIGVILNIVNYAIEREYVAALMSWNGLVGLVYYLIGIVLAIRFIQGGMRLEVFGYPENIPLSLAELVLLGVAVFKPTVENKVYGHGHKMSETLMEGISEFIEMFLSYITNSISYVRLGAFAIAHVALAQVAGIMAASLGMIPSYLIFNIVVILIEGFSAGIQSIRLLFYEFSTKFYRDDGRLFRPLRLL